MTLRAPQHVTLDEYLAIEESSDVRHELIGGVMYAMTGASLRHNWVAGRVYAQLQAGAWAGGCRPYVEGARLRMPGDVIYYPDVMVASGEQLNSLWESEPCLLVEVSSPSTETIDRREKLGAHLSIPSLLTYLIVDPLRPSIEVHERNNAFGRGWSSYGVGAGEEISLPCPAVTLAVDAIYAGLPPLE